MSIVTLCHPACPQRFCAVNESPGEGQRELRPPGGTGEPWQGQGSYQRPRGQVRMVARMGTSVCSPGCVSQLLLPHRGGQGYCKEGLKYTPAPTETNLHPPAAPSTPGGPTQPGEGDSKRDKTPSSESLK